MPNILAISNIPTVTSRSAAPAAENPPKITT